MMDIEKSRLRMQVAESSSNVLEEGRLSRGGDNVSQSESKMEAQNMHWFRAAITLIAETVSMGILSLPHAARSMGIIPAVILNILIGFLSTYTGITLWRVQIRHPKEISSYADFPKLLFGRWGGWVGGVVLALVLLLIMAAHLIAGETMLSTVTHGGACAVWYSFGTTVASIVLTLPRMFKANFWVSLLSCFSISAATIFTMIKVAQSHSHPTGYQLFVPLHELSVQAVAQGVSCITLSYMGHVAFGSIIREMENPKDFPKALCSAQASTTVLYTIVTIVITYFGGSDVKAIAIETASSVRARSIAWYMAIPTILGAGVILALVLSKNMHQAFWSWKGNPDAARDKGWRGWSSWIAVVILGWVAAWILSQVIPNFTAILSLVGALFGSWISFGFPALLWFGIPLEDDSEADTGNEATAESDDIRWSREAVGRGGPASSPEPRVVREEKSTFNMSTADRANSQRSEPHVGHLSERSLLSLQQSLAGGPPSYWQCAWNNSREHPVWAILNILLVCMCIAVMVLGMYGSITDLVQNPDNGKPFSCRSGIANLTSMA